MFGKGESTVIFYVFNYKLATCLKTEISFILDTYWTANSIKKEIAQLQKGPVRMISNKIPFRKCIGKIIYRLI